MAARHYILRYTKYNRNTDSTDWCEFCGYCRIEIAGPIKDAHLIFSNDSDVTEEFYNIPLRDIRYVTARHPVVSFFRGLCSIVSISFWNNNHIHKVHIRLSDEKAADELCKFLNQKLVEFHDGNTTLVEGFSIIEGCYWDVAIRGQETRSYYCCLDAEVLALYGDPTDVVPLYCVLFHLEGPSSHVVETMTINKSLKIFTIETGCQRFTFKLGPPLYHEAALIRALRKLKARSNLTFKDASLFNQEFEELDLVRYVGGGEFPSKHKRRPKPGETGASDSDNDPEWPESHISDGASSIQTFAELRDTEGSEATDALFCAQVASLINGKEEGAPENMQVLWVMAQYEIQELIQSAMVPHSSIKSGGLDHNDFTHFLQCINEIQDELFNQRYDLAVSHLRGARSVFETSTISSLRDALTTQDEISTLKGIFFSAASRNLTECT